MFYLGLWASKFYYRFFEKNKEADRMGIAALKFDDKFLYHIAKPKLVIAVTGTNGKTTTCNMLNELFINAGYKVAFNGDGCNLRPGLSKALILNTSIFNKPKADVAILEFDELSTKDLLAATHPDYVVCTNLFMDTMGRNGHTDFVFNKINEGLPEDATLILNADDLISSQLGKNNKKVFFSIEQLKNEKNETLSRNCDIKVCPKCYNELTFDFIRYHHIGKAHCKKCGFKNFESNYTVTNVDEVNKTITVNGEKYHTVNSSMFNIYNQVAALTVAKECNLKNISETFEKQEIVKSRFSDEKAGNIEIISQMTKGQNPASLSRAMDYVSNLEGTKELIMIIDDIFDKRSSERSEVISYIYDTDYECLNNDSIKRIIIGGIRGYDYKVRLLFAGISEEKIFVYENELDCLKALKYDAGKIVIINDMYQEKTLNKLKEAIKEELE